MSNSSGQTPDSGRGSQSIKNSFLNRIPVRLRVVFYCIFFLTGLLVVLPGLAYQIDHRLFPAMHIEIGLPLRIVGGVLLAIGLAAYLASSYLLTSRGRGAYVEFDPPTEFVATGPYEWVRNPVAASAVFMVLALAILMSSTGILILFLVGMLIAHAQVVFMEEPLLRQRFGQSYEDYVKRVPRWIPRRPRRDRG